MLPRSRYCPDLPRTEIPLGPVGVQRGADVLRLGDLPPSAIADNVEQVLQMIVAGRPARPALRVLSGADPCSWAGRRRGRSTHE